LRPWAAAIVAMYELGHDEAAAQRAEKAAVEFSEYLLVLARARRADPGDDLLSALVLAEAHGQRLSDAELVATCVLLLNAGHEATVNAFGNGLWALIRHPRQLAWLRADLARVPTAIEELLRFDTPLQLFRRWVYQDIAVGETRVKAGGQVGLIFGAANRDPAVFPAPDALRLDRAPNPHISFGAGIHFCLGAPLARLELAVAFTRLLARAARIDLVHPPRFGKGYVIRGLTRLDVALRAK
jgi:hypothetical protein